MHGRYIHGQESINMRLKFLTMDVVDAALTNVLAYSKLNLIVQVLRIELILCLQLCIRNRY